jgi:hypothetical protein
VNPNASNKNLQLYCYYMLKIFKPSRHEIELCDPDKLYYEQFLIAKEELPKLAEYHANTVCIADEENNFEEAIKNRRD